MYVHIAWMCLKVVEQTVQEKTGNAGKAFEDMTLDELDEFEDEEDERILQQYRFALTTCMLATSLFHFSWLSSHACHVHVLFVDQIIVQVVYCIPV